MPVMDRFFVFAPAPRAGEVSVAPGVGANKAGAVVCVCRSVAPETAGCGKAMPAPGILANAVAGRVVGAGVGIQG